MEINETTFPLKMDNDTLRFFVAYHLSDKRVPSKTYDDVVANSDAYQRLVENRAIMERLLELLNLDQEIYRAKKRRSGRYANAKTKILARVLRYRHDTNTLADLESRRKEAYDSYEMLRRLMFDSESGAVFVIKLR